MRKVLGIVVDKYPYGYAESFLTAELEELSKVFDQVLLFIPMHSELIKSEKQLFEIPPNVFVVPIDNKYNFWQKIKVSLMVGPFNLVRMIRSESKDISRPFNFAMFKTLLSYEIKEYDFRKKLWEQIKRRSLDNVQLVLYSYWFTEYTYSLYKLKKKLPSLKVYSRTHGWDVYFERHQPAYLPLRKPVINFIDGTFTVSDQAKNYLEEKLGIDAGKIETFRLGVRKFPENPFPGPTGTIHILSLSFIVPIKHLELLIQSLEHVDHSVKIKWFHIGGGDAYAVKVKDLAEKLLGLKPNINFEFLNTLSNESIRDFIKKQSIDLFINTSNDEGLPVSMMEAISAGIPIIGPEVGGIAEIIENGKNGFLLSKNPSIHEIAELLEKYTRFSSNEITELRKNAVITWETKFESHINYQRFAARMSEGLEDYFRSCSRCILTSADYPDIKLDQQGVCDICRAHDEHSRTLILKGDQGERQIAQMLKEIKARGKNKKYDCLLGISGGADSTYLAYLAKQWGLRPFLLHIDTGWNSTQAVQNIYYTVNKLGFDLHTYVVNWNEMKDLQLAFLKASVVDIDLPIDNTIAATTYGYARKYGIKYILTGDNIATEGWLPPNFNHNKNDLINLLDIHKKFGRIKLKAIPLINFINEYRERKVFRIKRIAPLNYMEYNQKAAKNILQQELGWKDYGSKHYENLFTRFYQGYILPKKFKVNKQKAHLSTLICSGQISRAEALEESKKEIYNTGIWEHDIEYFNKKMDLTREEFNAIMKAEPLPHTYYKSVLRRFKTLKPFTRIIRKIGLFK
jgi:N-acetyl sugar amidotransferase